MSDNHETNNTVMSYGGMATVSALLPQLHTLRTLTLHMCGLDDVGATVLAEALEGNVRVEELVCTYNQVGQEGAAALARLLGRHGNLCVLQLTSNRIGSAGACVLADSLLEDTTLQVLSLGFNGIGDEGACALGQMLATNASLQVLQLPSNAIQTEGALGLAQGVRNSSTLQRLELNKNHMGSECVAAFASALDGNKTLQRLHLRDNDFGYGFTGPMQTTMEVNRTCLALEGLSNGKVIFAAKRNVKAASHFVRTSKAGDVDNMAWSVRWGVCVDACPGRWTALEYAVHGEEDAMVELLRQLGACVRRQTVDIAREKRWRREWHWIGAAGRDGDQAMESALVMNSEEREAMFDAGGMDEYVEATKWERWVTLPDEVMERIVGWLGE